MPFQKEEFLDMHIRAFPKRKNPCQTKWIKMFSVQMTNFCKNTVYLRSDCAMK